MGKKHRLRVVPLLLLFLGSAIMLPASRAENFILIAYFDEAGWNPWGYDCDHDGWNELLFSSGIDTFPPIQMVKVYEHIGANNYQLVDSLIGYSFLAVGDLDGDGLTDAVTRSAWYPSGYDTIDIFESVTANSYPEQLVWSGPTLAHLETDGIRITDLDQDGRKEMLRFLGNIVSIFECTGDNTYEQVFEAPRTFVYWDLCTGDFDQDGKLEFVGVEGQGTRNRLRALENTEVGVDSFAITWEDTLPDARYTSSIAGANDMDQDGWPEFVVSNLRGGGYCVTVFEAVGDNLYAPVWADTIIGGSVWNGEVTCGDVDADGLDEICCGQEMDERIVLYKCVGPDSYAQIWEGQAVASWLYGMIIYDLNKNGYGEIVVGGPAGVRIYEKEIIGVNEMPDARYQMPEARLYQNSPNPFSSTTTIPYSLSSAVGGPQTAVSLSIYDAAGRLTRTLVNSRKEPGLHSVIWDGRDSNGALVAAGVYFCQLTAQQGQDASKLRRKLVVLR